MNGPITDRMQRPEIKKKLSALVVGALVLILNDVFELGISQDTLAWLAGLIGTYMLGQGMADIGKERAIIQGQTGIADEMEMNIHSREAAAPVAQQPKPVDPFGGRSFG